MVDSNLTGGWTPANSTPLPGAFSPPQAFSFEINKQADLERMNAGEFLSIVIEPVQSMPVHLLTEGGRGRILDLWRSSSRHGFLARPKYMVDKLTIRFVARGAMIRRNKHDEHIARPGRAMVNAFEDLDNQETSGDFDVLSGTIPRDALLACHRALQGDPVPPLPEFEPVVDVDTLPMRAFAQTFQIVFERLRAGLDEADLSLPLLEEVMIYQFLSCWPRRTGRSTAVAKSAPSRQVRLAADYIEANLSRKITLAEVAAAAGVSVRVLQSAFRQEFGTSPLQFITNQRLARAHADILALAGQPVLVSQIARRWGFDHMSDFSRRYRERYGLSPSETIRKT